MIESPTVVASDARTEAAGSTPVVDLERWERLAVATLRSLDARGELTLTFVDVADITELNEEHMAETGPTDVLSFPLDDEPTPGVPTLLGDVVIAPAVAAAQFADHAGSFDDELALLVVHGILHILGHDHEEVADAELMRAHELDLLSRHHWGGAPPAGFRQQHADD